MSDDSLDFNVNLNNFSGSLEILLDLAKSQKVDLEEISITKLADQFHQYLTEKENINASLAFARRSIAAAFCSGVIGLRLRLIFTIIFRPL